MAVQYRGYLGSLRAALAGRRVVAERLSVDDPASRQLLHQGLRSARAGEVIYSLSLLDGLDEVGLTMARGDAISTHEAKMRDSLPFLARGTDAVAAA